MNGFLDSRRGNPRPGRRNEGVVGMVSIAIPCLLACAGVLTPAGVNSAVSGDEGLKDWEYVRPSADFGFRVERFEANPIVHREMHGLVGEAGSNINGPSLIRVPDWIDNPLGRYYLYFAHHHGSHIRLAYADALEGPWKVYRPGVLHMRDTPGYEGRRGDHIASPDVHVDHERRRILMYYHSPNPSGGPRGQGTYLALSRDGLSFTSRDEYLGLFYFRVFRHAGLHYAFAKYYNDGGILYRSRDGEDGFEAGPRVLPRVRHMAVWRNGGRLYVFFSRGEDSPERILVSRVENLEEDWLDWRFTEPRTVLRPELDYEGVGEPIEPSRFGSVMSFVHQLRDPAIYEEDGRVFLLYSAAGEWSIAIAEIFLEEEEGAHRAEPTPRNSSTGRFRAPLVE